MKKPSLSPKKQLIAPCLLMYYDPKKEVTLVCDATFQGIEIILKKRGKWNYAMHGTLIISDIVSGFTSSELKKVFES